MPPDKTLNDLSKRGLVVKSPFFAMSEPRNHSIKVSLRDFIRLSFFSLDVCSTRKPTVLILTPLLLAHTQTVIRNNTEA